MDLDTLKQKIDQIKKMITDITGQTVEGNITLRDVQISFVIPPPFKPVVRLAARKIGFPISEKGIELKAKSLRSLDSLIDRIEEFEVELSHSVK